MKVYPVNQVKVKEKKSRLSLTEKITRLVALIIAFVTVYFFFFKILFF